MKCSCTIEAYDPDSAPDFFRVKERRARKKHRCCECGEDIERGDVYEYTTARWEDDHDISEFKVCSQCVEIRDCFCCTWAFTKLWEDLQQYHEDLKLEGLENVSSEARAKFLDRIELHELEGDD